MVFARLALAGPAEASFLSRTLRLVSDQMPDLSDDALTASLRHRWLQRIPLGQGASKEESSGKIWLFNGCITGRKAEASWTWDEQQKLDDLKLPAYF